MEENNKDRIEISSPDPEGVRTYSVREKNNKSKAPYKGVIIFGIIVLAIVILAVSCNNMVGRLFTNPLAEETARQALPDVPYIGTLYVEGSIASGNSDYFGVPFGYQHEWTLEQIDELIQDANNKGMVIFVDSPGGGVYESDELYLKIKEYQKETGRPVYAYMGSMAASGGYYISAPADRIMANRNCWTGSIGVTIGTLFDFSQLLQDYGIKSETITSGENKAMGSSFDELTPEQRAIFQGLVDEAYYQFAGIVAEEREMDMEKVLKIADGRIYTASQALENGLIDEISTFEEALQHMQKEHGLEDAEIVDITYSENTLISTLLGKLNLVVPAQSGDLSMLMKLVEETSPFPVSYMCETLK
jgi:protease-4